MKFFIDTANLNEIREAASIQILAASIRHPVHVLECAMAGADVATMPFKVIEALLKHPLTEVGLANFLKD